ncbi:class I SAM-dependent methyltransferase [Gordonia hankookensis]|uniref:S-adenosyl-L-methionine-dependent methyltransferase n=1 Tax=Gordonia hankookensis TaxID=589403 RepID=A0ABR7WIG9_9ACTN|nr:class I SAM-dependent methyltransferase [Gordonia hankookensis]
MVTEQVEAPESTAERVALWRAMHVQVDPPPHVLSDEVGLKLLAPEDDWRDRPDMDPEATSGFRVAIVDRARFIEDLVIEQEARGVSQYVILGAGLDTFAQRRSDVGARLQVFEVDQPGPQAWKRRRLVELGYGIPDWLHLVPVDFEDGESWWARLASAGFDPSRPAVVVSTGVSHYLSREATAVTLRQAARLAPGSTLVMTYLLPTDLVEDADRSGLKTSEEGAKASGTPFVSFYTPAEVATLARDAGLTNIRQVTGSSLGERYLAGRTDCPRPSSGEDLLVATI